MCAHQRFKTVAEVTATDVAGVFALKLFSTCAVCGSPLLFEEGATVHAQNRGLVGVVLATMGGD
jgi:hypothetical protein